MSYHIQDYSRTQIYITDLWREWYIPKFRIYMTVEEPYLTLYWAEPETGNPVPRKLKMDYNDVSGYGYANPSSASDLESIIDGYINSAWTDIGPGGNILNAKADLLSNDGASDTILPGGSNEYILSRDNAETTGLKWISKNAVGSGIWQPLDSDLTDIAGLTATTDNFIQAKSSAWASRTLAQVRTDLKSGLYATSITEVSGTATTAEELLVAFTIAGGACVDTDTVIVRALVTHSSTSGSQKIWRIRVDTSATGTTGTIVAEFQNNNSAGTTIPLKIWQDIKCKSNGGNTLETAYVNNAAFSLGILSVLTTANINLANTWYIKITSDKAAAADVMTFKYGDIEISKA